MARIRSIKPTFAGDSKVARLSLPARLTFLLLLPEADDEGRMVASSKRLVGLLYPNDDKIGPAQIDRWLKELEREEMIVRYTADGTRYLAITKFRKHQSPQHPLPSALPPPPENGGAPHEPLMRADGAAHEDGMSGSSLSVGELRGSRSGRGSIAPAPADAEKPGRPRDALWDSMLAACEIHEEPTSSARGAYNRARKDLAGVGATPEEIHRRADIHRLKWPEISLTPSSLARHWAECAVAPLHLSNGSRPRTPTTVDRSIANIMEGVDDRGRSPQDSGRPGHILAPARALEAGT